MKTLGLFRHAKSDWQDARARDFDRPLNARGRLGAPIMGRHVRDYARANGVVWNRILASPAARSAQTIELAAQGAGMDANTGFAVNWDRRIYLASSATLIDLLREQEDWKKSILLVGHNPGLEDLIFDLVPDNGASHLRDIVEAKFPTAAFAVIELDIDHWADLDDNCGRLVHLMRPRDLDSSLGPQAAD